MDELRPNGDSVQETIERVQRHALFGVHLIEQKLVELVQFFV